MPAPHPTLNAMLICDSAVREEGTGKVSLIGIFANITASAFPAIHSKLTIYVNVTDAQGHYKFRLEMRRVDNGELLGQADLEGDVADAMKPTEILFEIGPLVFDRAGKYEFRFYANDSHVVSKSFSVVQVEGRT
jgi:hypothetical protein